MPQSDETPLPNDSPPRRASAPAVRRGALWLVLILLTGLAVVQTVAAEGDEWRTLARATPRALLVAVGQTAIALGVALVAHRAARRYALWAAVPIVLVLLYVMTTTGAAYSKTHVWAGAAFLVLLALAALDAIPATLYEAAAVDRAGAWFTFRMLTLPLVAPLLLLAAAYRTLATLAPPVAGAWTALPLALLVVAILVGAAAAARSGR